MRALPIVTFLAGVAAAGCAATTSTQSGPPRFDVIVRRGLVYDGTGAPGVRADVGIRGDRIAAVGDLGSATAAIVVNADGLAVAPGFINMLSWSTESLLVDGRSLGDIRQGVTTEIFGEGDVDGAAQRRDEEAHGEPSRATSSSTIEWTTLAEYLRVSRAAGRLAERRVVHRRDDDPRIRRRPGGQEADARRAGSDARAGAAAKWRRARSASARR